MEKVRHSRQADAGPVCGTKAWLGARKQGEAPCKPFLIEPQDVERTVIAPDLALPVIGPEPRIEDFSNLDRALIETDSAWHGHAMRFMRLDLDVHAFASTGSGNCSGAIDSRVAMA
jgi:hypothetical protein